MLLKVGQILPLEGKRYLVIGVSRGFTTYVSKEDSERLYAHFSGPEIKQFRFIHRDLEDFKAGQVITQDHEYLELQQLNATAPDQWLRLYTYQRIYKGEKKRDTIDVPPNTGVVDRPTLADTSGDELVQSDRMQTSELRGEQE